MTKVGICKKRLVARKMRGMQWEVLVRGQMIDKGVDGEDATMITTVHLLGFLETIGTTEAIISAMIVGHRLLVSTITITTTLVVEVHLLPIMAEVDEELCPRIMRVPGLSVHLTHQNKRIAKCHHFEEVESVEDLIA